MTKSKYKAFYFEKIYFDRELKIAHFYYSFDKKVFFEEKIYFDNPGLEIRNFNIEIIESILFHIHLALGISYYKLFLAKELIVETGELDSYQKKFWKKFYINGLGEFLYSNNINPENLFTFISTGKNKYSKKEFNLDNRCLVPIGGGKDSIVSIELLRNVGLDIELFTFSSKDNILYKNTENISGYSRVFIKREISKTLFDILNDKNIDCYNGHVPITGIIAFVLLLVAYLYDYKYLILSNEKSANYGNIFWNNIEINHQYSKSVYFESDFGIYIKKYINNELKYFSLLRGLYEISIAKLFSIVGKKYFSFFSSCNRNFKILENSSIKSNYWCNECPKCLFVYIILRPFITREEVNIIFGQDLFDNRKIENIFRELLGLKGIKPFECVGEKGEVILAMKKSLEIYLKENIELPYMLSIFKNEIDIRMKEIDYKKLEEKYLNIYENETLICDYIKTKINFNKLLFNEN